MKREQGWIQLSNRKPELFIREVLYTGRITANDGAEIPAHLVINEKVVTLLLFFKISDYWSE
ncbi:hypothetical protein [Lacibacter cauensis]|uniref:hypothetical protein n=1 Tax=Lacibacter cauensis TaxID=510947 RepID=UPI001315770E|nr:hypothetical protein [Lacibacter cauensis]